MGCKQSKPKGVSHKVAIPTTPLLLAKHPIT